ncbi:alpha/beta fold hydrolase [Pelagibacterium flavum]|uniref:Alpha/beta fold hydrolase n=1 Tax=Pelagibacterium flavum TaxID=2984530 RepID=A0ABY6IN17_9HYPH|nr:alpha/beta hydrolase [Pelagibacterium sp. YIM 151497]MAN76350.1 alpha/beta hydrolase [Hyphomicrobiales bacterium]UYQ71991.1 alpha/beta fold hydrolase [Pelagibacterium sp. YIM 151497]
MSVSAKRVAATLALGLLSSVSLGAETVVDLPNGIRGTLAVPDSGASGAAVVVLHGFGSSRDEVGGLFAVQAADLAAKGIASLRIDFRGYGESEGEMADTTLEGLIADAATARTFLAGVEGVDGARLGVIGYSFGAAVAMLEPDDFKTVVVWGQMGDLQTEFHEFLGQEFYDRAAADGVASADLGWRTISLKQSFFESLARHDLADRFAGYAGSFLTIAGAADPAVNYFDQYLSLAAGRTDAVVIPGADHMLGVFSDQPEIGQQVIDKTTAWLGQTL